MKTNLILICLLLIFAGCNESQKTWGKGELPADYVALFGDDNTARLNKAQNDLLNKHQALLRGIDREDGSHINGIVDLVLNLQSRVTALEAVDPNDVSIRLDELENWTHNPYKLEWK